MTRENQTPAEREMYAQRARERERNRNARRKAKKVVHKFKPEISKTCPAYRRRLPPLPDMVLKSELREFLARAVQNTVEQ